MFRAVGEILQRAKRLVPTLQRSLGQSAKTQPFEDEPTGERSQIEPGQPFHLQLIGRLARQVGDPDWKYPEEAGRGVPLRVTEPTWRSPRGVWPTKDELTGMEFDPEDLEAPKGHRNYPSTEEFSRNIKETFREELDLGMTLGPYTKDEAARTCGCAPKKLCPQLAQ